jgi:hypothetical protein
MRKMLAVTALATVLSSCGSANATPHRLDPTSDLDCALTAYVFYLNAVQTGAPEKPTRGLHIANQWFAASMAARGYKPTEAEKTAVSDAILSDISAARAELNGCLNRANQDSRFSAFVDRMGWQR